MRYATKTLATVLMLLAAFGGFTSAQASENKQQPHEHQGKLAAYLAEPPSVELSDEDISLLESGQALFKKLKLNDAQRVITVFRVNADAGTIWSIIKDFNSYPQWIEDISNIEVYRQQDNLSYVQFTAAGLFGDTVWYAVHDYPQDQRNWGTWRLDYNYLSDLDDSVGFWRVVPVEGKTNVSDVIYSADLRLKGLFASLFEASLIDSSLKDATQWVKIQSEIKSVYNN